MDELGYLRLKVNFREKVDVTRFTDTNQETGETDALNFCAEIFPISLCNFINFVLTLITNL